METCAGSRLAFTLIELLIVIVLLSIVAGIVIRTVDSSIDESKQHTTDTNERLLRTAIQRYRAEHGGVSPILTASSLPQLVAATNRKGEIGNGDAFPYGPYLDEIPTNSLNNTNKVWSTLKNPPTNLGKLTGWWFNAKSGNIWAGTNDKVATGKRRVCP